MGVVGAKTIIEIKIIDKQQTKGKNIPLTQITKFFDKQHLYYKLDVTQHLHFLSI